MSAVSANCSSANSKKISCPDVNTVCLLSPYDVYFGGLNNLQKSFLGSAMPHARVAVRAVVRAVVIGQEPARRHTRAHARADGAVVRRAQKGLLQIVEPAKVDVSGVCCSNPVHPKCFF